jgi:hypothetical protein
MNRRAARLEPEHQAQQYLWSGIALKRVRAQRHIWPIPLAASCVQQVQNKFQFKSCSQAVWSEATHLATSISSEPDLRGELPASSAAISLVGYCSQAVWSEATKTKEKGQPISADLWKLLCAKVTF